MAEHPQTIGPYRVERRLGAGGMGEVLLAYDDRLDRRVAIKRIRPEAGTSPERRERFRREARVSARLNHPAIVQIYDILTAADLEYIVMEYVEGTDLHALRAQGALSVGQVLKLAGQLADGLDAAHRQGIVHRDLKAENVLVTAAGQAKITDFGIAKQLLAHSEESLTRANAVLGTCRTMSPEQARGEPVDHRTDLFALGVLLYEALGGRSPFEGGNALATLNRVIHHHQPPVHTLNPDVPAELSFLIDGLLQKDPAMRPQSAGQVRRELAAIALSAAEAEEGTTLIEPIVPPTQRSSGSGGGAGRGSAASAQSAHPSATPSGRRVHPALAVAGLAVIAAALAGGYFALSRPEPPLYVAVVPPEISAANRGEFELLASGVQTALLRGLTGLRGISPKSAEEVRPVAGPPVQVARAVAADEVVSTRLVCRPDACRVSLNRLRGSDGTVLWADSFEVPTDDFHLVANVVAGSIQRGYPGHAPRSGGPEIEVSSEDLKTFLQLRQRFDARTGVDLGALLAELEALQRKAPRSLDVDLLAADVARHRFNASRDPQDLTRALDFVRQAEELAPDDPQPLLMQVLVALDGQDLRLAEGTIEKLERMIPGDLNVLDRRALLLRKTGRLAAGIELLRAGVRRQPSWKRLLTLARLEQQSGAIPEARQHLEMLLERSPGNFEGLSQLAQIEMANGSLERAAALYGQLVQRSPSPAQMSNLGVVLFLLGRYPEAAGVCRRVVAEEPRNPLYTLNLADAYFLAGHKAQAEEQYGRVVALVEHDPSAGTPQFLTVKAQALAHLGRSLPAVSAVQEASRLAPDDAGVAYEAALVYALLGENASALVNAGKALRLGYDPRWFNFPWFDSLRSQPEFQRLLPARTAAR